MAKKRKKRRLNGAKAWKNKDRFWQKRTVRRGRKGMG
jgi:hypothetical protein